MGRNTAVNPGKAPQVKSNPAPAVLVEPITDRLHGIASQFEVVTSDVFSNVSRLGGTMEVESLLAESDGALDALAARLESTLRILSVAAERLSSL